MSPTTLDPTSRSLPGAVLSLGGSFGPSSDRARVRRMRVFALRSILTATVLLVLDLWCVPPFGQVAGMAHAAAPSQKRTRAAAKTPPLIAVAQRHAGPVAAGRGPARRAGGQRVHSGRLVPDASGRAPGVRAGRGSPAPDYLQGLDHFAGHARA